MDRLVLLSFIIAAEESAGTGHLGGESILTAELLITIVVRHEDGVRRCRLRFWPENPRWLGPLQPAERLGLRVRPLTSARARARAGEERLKKPHRRWRPLGLIVVP